MHERGVEAVDHVGDGAVATCYNIMRELCGLDWKPTEAWFAHHRPADVAPFREFFRVPLRFDAEQFALVFPAALPEATGCLRSMTLVRRLLQSEIDALEKPLGATTSRSRCVACCARRFWQGRPQRPTRLLLLFGMHSRTLNRHLSAYGVKLPTARG